MATILEAIGRTPLVRLRRLVPAGSAEVWLKLEGANPTGSMKDRMALAVIAGAEADGRLQPGGTVVEYTGGSTGASLALVCAAKGYRLRIVTSDAFAREKRDQMEALGAELTLVPSEGGLTTKKLILDMVEAARALAAEPGAFLVDQLRNPDAIAGYRALGEEILAQGGGPFDAFVHSVGTAASLRGVGGVLRARHAATRVVAVEPGESAVLAGGPAGPHKIEGVGIGYVPPLWEASAADAFAAVPTDEAKAMARRLAREEGVFAGTSTGANVVAALREAARLAAGRAPGALVPRVVTLACDSGLKYVNTDVFRAPWRAPAPTGAPSGAR